MKVVVTGSTKGIGRAITEKFLKEGHEVIGIDILPSDLLSEHYTHILADVADKTSLPDILDTEILINNAGIQTDDSLSIAVNLEGTIHCTEKYAFQNKIHSVVNIASASGHNGAEFPNYSASKGGVIAYTKNVALRIAKYGATCNSISPGGVTTDVNAHVMNDPTLWNEIMHETLIPKWASAEEIAEWTYFIAVINRSMTAQDILIDNGEMAKANFVW